MSHLLAYQPPPAFAAGIDMHATAGTSLLWDTIRILDMASVAPQDVFQGHSEHRHEWIRENPLLFWRGGFRYRAGLTTLAFYVDASPLGSGVTPRFRVYVNDVLRIDLVMSSGVQLYSSTAMATWGLVDGAAVDVRVDIVDIGLLPGPGLPGEPDNPSDPQWGFYYICDAWVGPASAIITDSWPGVPTFGGAPSEAGLLQLGNAGLWLARRMNAVPLPLYQRVVAAPDLPWWTPEPSENLAVRGHLWSGGGPRGPYDRLRIRVVWVPSRRATSQRIRLLINGSEVATTATWDEASSWGVHDFDVNLSGYGASTMLRVVLDFVASGTNATDGNARITVEWVEFHRSSPPLQTLSNRPSPLLSASWATRRTRLNAMVTWLQTIYDRVIADGNRWDRIRLFRSSYAFDLKEAAQLQGRYHAVRRRRGGTRLIVRGSNIKLAWGAVGYTLANPEEEFGEYTWTWASEETLVSGDVVETREVFLDAMEGLEPGFSYTVFGGDVRYAAEELL